MSLVAGFGVIPAANATSPDKTILALETLAQSGSTQAAFELGRRYEAGIGDDPNFSKASEYYCKAASKAHPPAAYRLGLFYLSGKGVIKDEAMAAAWLRRSVELGNAEAGSVLSSLGSIKGIPTPTCRTSIALTSPAPGPAQGTRPSAVPTRPTPDRTEGTKPPVARKSKPEKKQIYELASTGSGFYVNNLGNLVTNHHVVAGCDKVTVELPEGSVAAEVVDSDRILDLAVLRTASHPAAHARIRQQSAVLGESVYLFGYPQRGLLQSINMTNGIVSSMTGFKGDEGELQTSAATQPGNSGGPLVDSTGAVIGVISSILRNSQNVSFAIKNTLLVEYLNAQGVPLATSNVQTVSVTDIAKEAQGFTYPVACHLLRDEKK